MLSHKLMATVFSVAMLVVVASPVVENWKSEPRDGFPLSYYPMFSFDRSDRQRVTYLVWTDAVGQRLLLPYWYVGSGGMNQVRRQMTRVVNRGDGPRLCRTVASRVGRSDLMEDVPGPGAGTVEVVTGTFRLSRFFAGDRVPVSESVRARCSVKKDR